MNKYLLDTNICIHYLKNEYNIAEKISDVGFDNCYISELTIMELMFGVENSSDRHRENNKKRLQTLEQAMETQIIPIRTAFEVYAIEKTRLKRLGQMIAEIDMLIAATALANDLVLVTRNVKHFERIENLIIQNWIE